MIEENVKTILQEIPDTVLLEAAAKTRTADQVQRAASAGVHIVGENYYQEAERVIEKIGKPVPFHFIGHLQRNKVKKAIEIFDMIETLDSLRLAGEINKRCGNENKCMDVLIEVNSGREPQKYGIVPEEVEQFLKRISSFENLRVKGLMTMGPFTGDPE
ncbi:MAG: YggS family pyridoxal phosphate enzyme, partial [bacterium]